MTARSRAALAALLAGALAVPAPARAWETSTQTGLAEQAALAAGLDVRLRALGFSGGLFEELTVPPADAAALLASLSRYSPIEGFVPDARGRQYALAWLLAGAALAGATPGWEANHFAGGWRAPGKAFLAGIVNRALGGQGFPGAGMPANRWMVSDANPLGLHGFLNQYDKAARAATPGERGRALAGALIAAGAMMHVLGDMGSPARVRGDFASFDEPIGNDGDDRGSRFERLTALAWGRLGVPEAIQPVSRATLDDFFSGGGSADAGKPPDVNHAGLADWTASHFFSPHTLPRPIDIGTTPREKLADVLAHSQSFAWPAVPRRLNTMAAGQAQGATLRDGNGVCLARYRVNHGRLSWWLDDDCLLEQAQAILPVAAGFEAGLLGWLLRGNLRMAREGDSGFSVTAHGVALGKGTLTLLAEDGRGVRTPFATVEPGSIADGAQVGAGQVPPGARKIVALFSGVDGGGQPLVAVGVLAVP